MAGESHRALRESLGSYALGRLESDEEVALRGHLEVCASCRGELAELIPVVKLLASVDGDTVARLTVEPPHGDQAGRPARPGVPSSSRQGSGEATQRCGSDPAMWALEPGVDATATAVSRPWGMEIGLVGSGFQPDAAYEVVVLATDGARVAAGRFRGTGTRPVRCTLTCSVAPDEAVGFAVLDARAAVIAYGQL